MSRFAIIETGGKQYRIAEGERIKVEKLTAEAGNKVLFDKVLLTADRRGDDWDVKIGTPYVAGVMIEAEVIRQARDRKKIVFRYHSKTRYRKTKGHRQHFTEIYVKKI